MRATRQGAEPQQARRSDQAGALEVWGGVECTVNRVGDRFIDQLSMNGHAERIEDLDRFAALGLRALRYPLLWERLAPDGGEVRDWSWADARMARLRSLGIRPIVGLVHHGSGPRTTHLLDPAFGAGLAAYAAQVAARYPWVCDYTPVNEPLTTARFSALYGHWYPHRRDDAAFVRALLVQCRGVALAMQAIRTVNPNARLVQTEDLGKTTSTRAMAARAEFENQRRWLSFDLLFGRIDERHALWSYLRESGATAAEILWFAEHPTPPDIIGINYYITGERFIDHRWRRYPGYARASQAPDAHADVVAARTTARPIAGSGQLLLEAWDRYGAALAVTEAHLACTREEQLRWVMDIWRDALALRRAGVDMRAVTLWSLLGSFDWDSLLTESRGHYESGVFDLRASSPRPTALAHMARALASHGDYTHPVVGSPGWWHRPIRLEHPTTRVHQPAFRPSGASGRRPVLRRPASAAAAPILVTGAGGTLGHAFVRICDTRGLAVRALGRAELDIADAAAVERVVDEIRPWAIVNTAGWVRIDDAEREPQACWRVNADGPEVLAKVCAGRGLALLNFSTDQVFDGKSKRPYEEDAPTGALNVYGASKAAAEQRVAAWLPSALTIRTSAFFGPWDRHNFVFRILRELAAGGSPVVAEDETLSPTYVPDLVHAALDLLIDGEAGIWHLANAGAVSWADLARAAAVAAGLDASRLRPEASRGTPDRAARPAFSALASRRGWLMPSWEQALGRYLAATPGWR